MQQVKCNGAVSSFKIITRGVSQGSNIDSLLFLLLLIVIHWILYCVNGALIAKFCSPLVPPLLTNIATQINIECLNCQLPIIVILSAIIVVVSGWISEINKQINKCLVGSNVRVFSPRKHRFMCSAFVV